MLYYRITYDSGCENTETIADYEMGSFDLRVFWQGEKYNKPIAPDVRLYILEDEGLIKPDILPNPISWLIVSQKLKDIWWPFIKDDVQEFDPPIYRKSDGSKVHGYTLLNPIRALDCLDDEHSEPPNQRFEEYRCYHRMCIIESQTHGHHIFRTSEYIFTVIVSDTLAQVLNYKNIRGIAFIRCKTL